ncbi:unnamed protein product [Caenorhabditis auriculariae]|uniref:Innexin n=1 Tax=Caenorhabditis auriculariae TaxID=2777116 RepID=A0A8S1HIF5_9PELO|nr:unnamed protein product [Caenorhabditis auriculariae]
MLSNINNYVGSLRAISKHDDDAVDRLNYVYTTRMLLALSVLLFTKNYVGEPLQCWVPKQFTESWEVYTEQYCFIENTYFSPMSDENLPPAEARASREMIYYQWVPFILLGMAFLFGVPRVVWSLCSTYSGLAIADLMSAARMSARDMKPAGEVIAEVAQRVNRKKLYGEANAHVKFGSNLFNVYIVMKVLILVNVFLQFVLLNQFLGTQYTFWGLGVFWDMVNGRHWQQSGHFPRVAFCDLNVRELGNINHWTVQCVLMVNMFNEKIFIFIWFWFLFVLLLTVANVGKWLVQRFSTSSRKNFVATLLEDAHEMEPEGDPARENRFYETVLKDDGVLAAAAPRLEQRPSSVVRPHRQDLESHFQGWSNVGGDVTHKLQIKIATFQLSTNPADESLFK